MIPIKVYCAIMISLYCVACGQSGESHTDQGEHTDEVVFVADPDKVLEGPVVTLPKQVINLKGGGLLFVTVAIQLVDLNPLKDENTSIPRYVDTLILVVSEFDENELIKPDGKEKLSGMLLEKFNESSDPEHQVAKVFFENFIVR